MAIFAGKWGFAILLKRFSLLSSDDTNNYVAAFCMIGGVISIITGLLGLFILTRS